MAEEINALHGKLEVVWQCGKCETEHVSSIDTDTIVEADVETRSNYYDSELCNCYASLWRKPIRVFCPICSLVNVVNGELL